MLPKDPSACFYLVVQQTNLGLQDSRALEWTYCEIEAWESQALAATEQTKMKMMHSKAGTILQASLTKISLPAHPEEQYS